MSDSATIVQFNLHLTSEDKVVYATMIAMSSLPTTDLEKLSSFSDKEADTRIFVHVANAVHKGFWCFYKKMHNLSDIWSWRSLQITDLQ